MTTLLAALLALLPLNLQAGMRLAPTRGQAIKAPVIGVHIPRAALLAPSAALSLVEPSALFIPTPISLPEIRPAMAMEPVAPITQAQAPLKATPASIAAPRPQGTPVLRRKSLKRFGSQLRTLRSQESLKELRAPNGTANPSKAPAALRKVFDNAALTNAADDSPRRRRAKVAFSPATEADLPRIMEIVEEGQASNSKRDSKGRAMTGSVATDGIEEYRHYINSPHAYLDVARDQNGVIQGFALFYTKAHIDRTNPAEELNLLAVDAIEAAHGPDEDLVVFKRAFASRHSGTSALGRKLLVHVITSIKRMGIRFGWGTIVNDSVLEGTEYDVPGKMLTNIASTNAFGRAPGVRKMIDRFLYAHHVAEYRRTGVIPEKGIHNWELYGLSLDATTPFPDIEVPEKNRPPEN